MSELLGGLSVLGDALFLCFTSIFQLYTAVPLLMVSFGVWVLHRIFKLFHLL